MKVAIISDIHDNAPNLVLALEKIYQTEAKKIIFLGDFVGAAIAELLATSQLPVYGIWGNNDGDKALITKIACRENSRLKMGFDNYDVIEINQRNIFLTHYPLIARAMAKSGDFDAVFYGHNHEKNKEKIEKCLLLNPGEIGAYKTAIASFAIYDSEKNEAEIIILEDSITTNTETAKHKFKEINFKFNRRESHKL